MVAISIAERGIDEVLHFTTNHGCLGTLFRKHLMSRARLTDDELVEHLFKPNAEFRKDAAHLDYVNFSVNHINGGFYAISSNKWHRYEDIFWVILSFDPIIMTHDNVLFATTNNMYTSVKRAPGRTGLEALFANVIERWFGNQVKRGANFPPGWPTCEQAEVLYPGQVPTSFLKRIYTRSVAEQSEVVGFLRATFHEDVDVIVDPAKFEGRK